MQELWVKFHRMPSIAPLRESTGWVGSRDRTHLMRATLWQVLNVPDPTYTGCSIGVEVCRQTTVAAAAADKGT